MRSSLRAWLLFFFDVVWSFFKSLRKYYSAEEDLRNVTPPFGERSSRVLRTKELSLSINLRRGRGLKNFVRLR